MVVAAIDLGGTFCKVGIVRAGKVVSERRLESRATDGLARLLPLIVETINDQFDEARLPRTDLAGVGFALPCLIDAAKGRVVSTPQGKFDDAADLDLASWCAEQFGAPFRLENDAHAALLGEWTYGAGRGTDDFVNVTLGTGIGTSVLIRGELLRGRHYQAGVLGGHFSFVPGGKPCICGGIGCVETECGSWALPKVAAEDPRYPGSALSRESLIDYTAVFRLADAGDAVASDLRDRAIAWWSSLLVTLIHAYDPERIVVGGGIMGSAAVILPKLQAAATRAWTPWGTVQVVASELGSQAALLGMAAALERELAYL